MSGNYRTIATAGTWACAAALTLGATIAWAQGENSGTVSTPPATLQIAGMVMKPARWTAAQMATQFAADIHPLEYTLKGVHHTAKQAIPLRKLIEAAALRVNPHVKHGDLQFVIAVEGHDGYTVDFSYAELVAEIGNRPVWVALDEDGKPLTGEAAPAELIVPDDVKPARWVHSLARIVVIDGSQVADQAETK